MKKQIKNILIIFSAAVLILLSCEKDERIKNTCDVKNPLKDIQWLVNDIDFIKTLDPQDSQYITISMATYHGESVFYSAYCDPLVEQVWPIRNCAGEIIGYWGIISPDELLDKKVIWRSLYCICEN